MPSLEDATATVMSNFIKDHVSLAAHGQLESLQSEIFVDANETNAFMAFVAIRLLIQIVCF